MAFHSGRVTFARFRVIGDAPLDAADPTTLATLAEHSFRETEIGAPEEVEAGWTTGEHLMDTRFTYEKNSFGPRLLFALRVDTHKVPSDVKQAYKRMNEQAAASTSPTGFTSKSEKRTAAEEADRELREQVKTGRFRRSKAVPIMWDLHEKMVYVGALGNTVIEHTCRMFRESFNVDLQRLSAGTMAQEKLESQGKSRDWEDLRPTAFTAAPTGRTASDDDDEAGPRDPGTPSVPWLTRTVDTKDFLGNEWLLWLWHLTETQGGVIEVPGGEAALAIDKTLDMECAWGIGGKQSLRGDAPTRLREAAEALRTGKWPRKAGLILSDGEQQWELTLQSDALTIGSAALPEITDAQSPRELIEARLDRIAKLAALIDELYTRFLADRVSGRWPGVKAQVGEWITTRKKK